MSAKILNKTNYNGWNYFYVNYKNSFIPLDELINTLYEKYLISFVKPLISSNFAIVLKQNER